MGVGSQGTVGPPAELALLERVQALEAIIEQARALATTGTETTSTASAEGEPAAGGDFAAALQAAAADSYASTAPAAAQGELGSTVQTSLAGGTAQSQYEPLIDAAAERYGIEPALLDGLIEQESGFDPSAQSSAGASGLTQLMPSTASAMGVADPLDPAESIEGGARYLSGLLAQFGGNTVDALAAYNAGPGAVEQFGGVPPYAETQNYVSSVLGYAEDYGRTQPTAGASA